MDPSTFWWLTAGALVIVELLTGTFYLLMLSIGAVAGALAAYVSDSLVYSVVAAALVGGSAVVIWNWRQQSQPTPQLSQQHLDVGETVTVQEWDAQGQTHVKHRGAQWVAISTPGVTPEPGLHRIVEVSGSRLVLEKI